MKLIDPATGQAVWDSNDPNAGPVPPAPEGRQWVRVDEPGDTMAPRRTAPGILDIGNGVTERLAFLNQTFNPVEGIGSAMRAGSRMVAPDQSYWDRIASLGEMASGVASIAAPIAAAKAIGVPAASAMMEGLLGFSPAGQAAGDMATQFARSESGALTGGGPGRAPLDVSRRDASNIFGEGSERVRYTDPQSGGTIEVVVRPDGSASVLELEVPEASRGQGIGQTLQERVMQDFPMMGGQVSSKAAATTAYRLGRRPPGKPDATLEEVFADIDEMSSVNMVSPAMQERLAPAAPALPAPRNEAEAMARDILRLRAEGRAGEVTEEMMAAADDQYMYFNTPLPMDYASRMARAIQEGFDVNDEMYRGDVPRQSFETGRGQRDQIGVTASSVPDVAASYIPARGEGGIYPLFSRGQNDAVIEAGGQNWNVILPDTPVQFQGERSRLDEYIPVDQYFEPYDVKAGTAFFDTNDLSRIFQGYGADRVRFSDLVDRGASAKYYGPQSSSPSDVTMVANPANVRSRFARFDPAFANLRNLSAGVGGAAVLTALGDDAEAGTPETQIMDLVKQSGVSGAAQILGVSRRDIEEAISIAVPPSQWDQLVVGPQ